MFEKVNDAADQAKAVIQEAQTRVEAIPPDRIMRIGVNLETFSEGLAALGAAFKRLAAAIAPEKP